MSSLKIVLTPQELVEKLALDVAEVLRLRNVIYYHRFPDEESADAEAREAWEVCASEMSEDANRMGGPLADAVRIVDALRRYVERVEGEGAG